MSIEAALAFLREARRDEALSRELAALNGAGTWEALSETASRAGYEFAPDELERAHRLDWGLRWARYQPSS